MMKLIYMTYFRGNNFGDALSPQLIEELSGLAPCYKSPVHWFKYRVIQCLHPFGFRKEYFKVCAHPSQKILLAIGSILKYSTTNCEVWGAGYMNKADHGAQGTIYALRGLESLQKLKAEGKDPGPIALGDPALLLPLWLDRKEMPKRHKLGIIPHYTEFEYFRQHYGDCYPIIDLRTSHVTQVVDEICACEHILSTSLHGIIVAQAYGIPALWMKHGDIETDGFKFRDYFSAVGIAPYPPLTDLDALLDAEAHWQNVFALHKEQSTLQTSLPQLQRSLLKAAPFHLKPKYRTLLEENETCLSDSCSQ